MDKVRVGINGAGRIGRTLIREWVRKNFEGIEIVAFNNPGQIDTYAQLMKYDSCHGHFPGKIEWNPKQLVITSHKTVGEKDRIQGGESRTLHYFNQSTPDQIDWASLNIDIVIDATGFFKKRSQLSGHLGKSVKKVIMCAPGNDLDATIIPQINEDIYRPERHHIISSASCTTNCLAPLFKVLQENWTVESGFMSTIHAYTLDQRLLDGSHKDSRRARSATQSIIPTSTGAARALGKIFPNLEGKVDGVAYRVPTPNVSMVDLSLKLKESPSIDQIDSAMREAASGSLSRLLAYSEEELVSVDYMGDTHSAIFDSQLTNKVGELTKVVAWYDNETGFSNRVLELTRYLGTRL